MEFLMAIVTLLRDEGYSNPALFALEYTLVPDACYPTQIQQAFAGYDYVLSLASDPSRVCVSGDSAGATLILSLLLYMGDHSEYAGRLPGLAALISPWVTLVSQNNRNTASDYLDSNSLHLYGKQYAGGKVALDDPMVSPGNCKEPHRWVAATPKYGWHIMFGSEEVLGPETRYLILMLRDANLDVDVNEEEGNIHAWPVASLYLGETAPERLRGIRSIVSVIKQRIR
jgi:acetyl esterase/lipase